MVWVDGGAIRQNGPTYEVVGAYESAMASGERDRKKDSNRTSAKGRFVRWEVAGNDAENANLVTNLGPLTVRFFVQVSEGIKRGVHGVALFDADRHLMWARAASDLDLAPGLHVLDYRLPMLPLKPGIYQWQVSLWEDSEMLEMWECTPDMNIATEGHQHYSDQWNGILNLPSDFSHSAAQEMKVERSSSL